MRILFADSVPDWFPAKLAEAGCSTHLEPTLEGAGLTQALASFEPEVLVVRSTKVQAEQLAACSSLKLVIRAGAGVNTIDTEHARQRGIAVANCPGMNADAVAELAIGHLINLDRRIADNVADLRRGAWAKKKYSKAQGLRGRTLGLLGFGNIGVRTARIAKAMGMQLVYWDPFVPQESAHELGARKLETPAELAAAADAISIHLAMVPATAGLCDGAFFAAMKPGAFLINTSRAGIIDEAAMYAAIEEKDVRLGVDVFWNEPAANATEFTDKSATNPNIYGTHHIGASTGQAQDAVGEEAFRIIEQYLADKTVLHQVNPF